MTASTAAPSTSTATVCRPEGECVAPTYSTKEVAGRYAVARRPIAPGELVLAAVPYGLVLNPSYCPSALQLSVKAAPASAVAAAEELGVASPSGKGAKKSKANTAGAKAARGKHGAATAGGASASGGDAFSSTLQQHHAHALQGDAAVNTSGDSSETATSTRWHTTSAARCAVCFDEIAAGRWLCNRGSLAELAMDMSREQEELEAAVKAAAVASRGPEGGGGGDVDAAEEREDADACDSAATALKKLKKPTKSAKTRKGGAVELKQRLLEKAQALREELLYKRHLQRRQRAQESASLVRREGWEASESSPAYAAAVHASAAGQAMAGCTGCGVLCYCSHACWRAHRATHVDSGECAVLRALYPRLMAEYYATAAAAPGAASAVMPGDEALHWTSSTSEPRMLEFQSLLFSAVVLARLTQEGYMGHCAVASETPAAGRGVPDDAHDDRGAAEAVQGQEASKGPPVESEPADARPAALSSTVNSIVVPKEVHTIQELRAKAGLTGTVEVLDADAALRDVARADAVPEVACALRGSAAGDDGEHAPPVQVRVPRYADLAQMETNLTVISKARRSTYQRYYRAFAKRVLPLLQSLPLFQGTASQPPRVLEVSEAYFQRLCAATQCNSFGVYDLEDHCVGFGMYPAASYFNHSCVPNLCRVMHHGTRLAAFYALRPITALEPLTICYTDVEQLNSAERRRNLLETYRFFCQCERCAGTADGPQTALGVAAAPFEKPLLLCAACAIRGYLRPLPPASPPPAASPPQDAAADTRSAACAWSMAEVQVRECTVCRARVVREAAEPGPGAVGAAAATVAAG